jgi:hypothetical protein
MSHSGLHRGSAAQAPTLMAKPRQGRLASNRPPAGRVPNGNRSPFPQRIGGSGGIGRFVCDGPVNSESRTCPLSCAARPAPLATDRAHNPISTLSGRVS